MNVRTYAIAADLRYSEVEALLQTVLKPLDQMKPAEIAHIVESARQLPDLYGWPPVPLQE